MDGFQTSFGSAASAFEIVELTAPSLSGAPPPEKNPGSAPGFVSL